MTDGCGVAKASEIEVSVVVPFRNGDRFAPALLRSLAEQRTLIPWEIVAVDNRSTDATRRLIETYVPPVSCRVVDAPLHANPAYARNVGARAARGRKLLFVDVDDELDPEYVDRMSSALDDHPFVTSRVDSTSLNAGWLQAAHGEPWQAEGVWVALDFLPASGVNCGIHRARFEAINGFPEEFSGAEDVAFAWIAHRAGLRVHFVRDAVYHYRHRDTLRGLYHQAVNWGRDHARLFKRFGPEGMPRKTITLALKEWCAALSSVSLARNRQALAPAIVRLGFCVGRLKGSCLYGVRYL